jgi:hypothetical protein
LVFAENLGTGNINPGNAVASQKGMYVGRYAESAGLLNVHGAAVLLDDSVEP